MKPSRTPITRQILHAEGTTQDVLSAVLESIDEVLKTSHPDQLRHALLMLIGAISYHAGKQRTLIPTGLLMEILNTEGFQITSKITTVDKNNQEHHD